MAGTINGFAVPVPDCGYCYLYETGRASYPSVTDEQALLGVKLLCETEGILPALESAHAIYYASEFAKNRPADENDPDYGIIILRVVLDEKGEELYESIDDDDELNDVYEHFMAILFDDEDGEVKE